MIDEKFVSTQYTTRQNFETTAAPNPNTIEDSVTETLLTVIPTESSTRETIAAVSQPRPFGFPRRTRPTTATSTISDTTRSSVTGIETTTRPKVSTYSRNFARSTTKAPRTRTRSRTRNREKSTVDDEYLSLKDEALENNSELQENIKDTGVVSRSRSTISSRGYSRFKSQNNHSRNSNANKDIHEKESTMITEATNRRHRRPLKATTDSNNLEVTQAHVVSSEQPLRNRSIYRTSRVRLDQQAAGSFDTKAEAGNKINLLKETTTLPSTYKPITTEAVTDKIDVYTENTEETTQTENPRFLIEVTESIPSDTTTDIFIEETFNTLESSLQTTVPSFLWSSYITTLVNSEEDIQTTNFETTTESILRRSTATSSTHEPTTESILRRSTATSSTHEPTTESILRRSTDTSSTHEPTTESILRRSTATSSTHEPTLTTANQRTRKVLLRKRPSTTPISIEHQTQDSNSKRRKVVRRLRPLQNENSNLNATDTTKQENLQDVNDDGNRAKSTPSSFTSPVTPRPSRRGHFIRKTTAAKNGDDVSTPKIVSEVTNKRKNRFDRYRTTPQIFKNQQDVADQQDTFDDSDSIDDDDEVKSPVTSRYSSRRNKYKIQDSDVEESEGVSERNLGRTPSSDSRKSRTRFRHNDTEPKDFENFMSKNKVTSRYISRSTTTTESSIQETLIPTKKFDYFADAAKRGNQLQKTTPKYNGENTVPVSTSKPLVTRLVTSIVESATTERQRISIKKKYSSLTSTAFIPKNNTTTLLNLKRHKQKGKQNEQLLNEIPRGFSTEQSVEWSTLPIESEFADKKVTTEPNEESSSTIEIESVFSNLIGH